MPRFFFYVVNGHGEIADDEGSDAESHSAARKIALDSIRSMVAEDARAGRIDLSGRIEIKDASRNILLTVCYAEAFDVRMPEGSASD